MEKTNTPAAAAQSARRAETSNPFPPLATRTPKAAARAAFAPRKNRVRVLHRNGQFRYA